MANARDIAIPTEFVTQVTPAGARRLGLVVGIDSYADSGIPNLKAAIADARAMHALMVDPACGLFDPEHTQVLIDADATRSAIERALERLRRAATPDDEVWIYFAGHGVIHEGTHRLIPADGEREYLDSTSVQFAQYAAKIRCRRKIVFLDCCHSGASDASTRDIHSVDSLLRSYDASGTITFCSSDGHEKSVELPDVGRGAFSYWLERGLRGEADANGDGVVTSTELWEFVRRNVEREAMQRTGARQTPRVKLDASGAFALSVSRDGVSRMSKRKTEVEECMKALRTLMGEESYHLTKGDLLSARRALESSDEQDRRAVQRIRRALEMFREDGDEEFAAQTIRSVLQARMPQDAPSASVAPQTSAAPTASAPPQPEPPIVPPTTKAPTVAPITVDRATPIDVLRVVASKGDAEAQFELGVRYEDGIGIGKDAEFAVECYRRAANQNHADALASLAACYERGNGVAPNEFEAIRLYRRAAGCGQVIAQHLLAMRLVEGRGTELDRSAAMRWLRMAAEKGYAPAQFELGQLLRQERSFAEAATWLAKAADQQHARAQLLFGCCYDNGEGVDADPSKAAFWYSKSAVQGDPEGQLLFGQCLESGRGVPMDRSTALTWFLKSAMQGTAMAQVLAGLKFQLGIDVAKDLEMAAHWFALAADQGDAEGQRLYADCHANGWGVRKDLDAAERWYRKAAEQDNVAAQVALGDIYAQGIGVERDPRKAAAWYRRACNGEESAERAEAFLRFGVCCLHGFGVTADRNRAVKWLIRSAGLGSIEARAELDRLRSTPSSHGTSVSAPASRRESGGEASPRSPSREVAEAAGRWKACLGLALSLPNAALYEVADAPANKLLGALEYAKVESKSDVLVFYDDTVFGSAGDGFLLSWAGIYWKAFGEAPNFLPWERVATVAPKKGWLSASIIIVDSAGVSHPPIQISGKTPQILMAFYELIRATHSLRVLGTKDEIEAALRSLSSSSSA